MAASRTTTPGLRPSGQHGADPTAGGWPDGLPPALRSMFGGGAGAGGGGRPAVPDGAAKMQTWHVDSRGRHHDVPFAVPVDAQNRRTKHIRGECTKPDPTKKGGVCGVVDWWLPSQSGKFCPKHGALRTTAGPPGDRADRRRLVAKETSRLHGASAGPWLVLPPIAGVGVYVAVTDVWPALVALITGLAGIVAYLAGGVLLRARAVKLGRLEPGQRRGRRIKSIDDAAARICGHVVGAGLWVLLVAVAPPVTTNLGLAVWAALPAGWAVRAYPWWARVDRRRSRGAVTPQPEAAVDVPKPRDAVESRAVEVWAAVIGQQSGPLAGTHLTDFRRLPSCKAGDPDRLRLPNWTATVRANAAGTINMRENRPQLVGRIAAAYGCSYGDVSFVADESDLGVAYVRVQPDNRLAEVRFYQGPDEGEWATGVSAVGRHDDDEPLRYSWYSDTGAVHDLLSGCTGSGKSELVAQLLLKSLCSAGRVIDWVGDPQGGQSYGALKDAVDWFAPNKTEIQLMLLAAVKEMYRRNDELARTNVKTWRLTADMPLLVITLDELQSYIDDPVIVDLVDKLVGMGRKCGIKVRVITQIPAAYSLGGSSYIKEQLRSGQVITFRATTAQAGRSATENSESPIDPTQLAERWGKATCGAGKTTAGLCYVQGIHGRDVYARADYTGEDAAVWLYHRDGTPATSPGRFADEARRVSGILWGGRKDRAAWILAAGRSDGDLLPGGKAIELIEMAAAIAAGRPTDSGLPYSAGDPGRGGAEGSNARQVVLAAAAHLATQHPQGHVERKALVAATTGQIAAGTCDKAIGDLVADGSLNRVKPGLFTVERQPAADTVTEGSTTH